MRFQLTNVSATTMVTINADLVPIPWLSASPPWTTERTDPASLPASDSATNRSWRSIMISPMRYLTAAGFAVLTAIATAILWIVIGFVLPIALPFLLSRTGLSRSGSGGAGAVIGSGSILLAALLGFLGGVVWMLWRR
jgi:hypothetical protein